MKDGSWWIIDRVEKLTLKSYRYEPLGASSYIPTPMSKIGKKAIMKSILCSNVYFSLEGNLAGVDPITTSLEGMTSRKLLYTTNGWKLSRPYSWGLTAKKQRATVWLYFISGAFPEQNKESTTLRQQRSHLNKRMPAVKKNSSFLYGIQST